MCTQKQTPSLPWDLRRRCFLLWALCRERRRTNKLLPSFPGKASASASSIQSFKTRVTLYIYCRTATVSPETDGIYYAKAEEEEEAGNGGGGGRGGE